MADSPLPVRPWQTAVYEQLARQARDESLPQGLILSGPERSAASRFAGALARLLICLDPGTTGPCGQCRSCQLNQAGNHPDYLVVEPDSEERPTIKVDQIRELSAGLTLASQYGGRRVAVIELADWLTIQAANSLLKTLEEPPARVIIVLVAASPERLTATVRSRCRRLTLPLPAIDAAEAWLEMHGRRDAATLLALAGGCPERSITFADEGLADYAPSLAGDILQLLQGRTSAPSLAARWAGTRLATLAFLNEQLLADCLRAKAGGSAAVRLPANDDLVALVTTLPWRVLYEYRDELTALRRAMEQPLNEALTLERLFLGWSRIVGATLSNTG